MAPAVALQVQLGRAAIPLELRPLIRRMASDRVIGTARRECLNWLLPVSQAHLRAILKCWANHYNGGRPHSALAPGVLDPPEA